MGLCDLGPSSLAWCYAVLLLTEFWSQQLPCCFWNNPSHFHPLGIYACSVHETFSPPPPPRCLIPSFPSGPTSWWPSLVILSKVAPFTAEQDASHWEPPCSWSSACHSVTAKPKCAERTVREWVNGVNEQTRTFQNHLLFPLIFLSCS